MDGVDEEWYSELSRSYQEQRILIRGSENKVFRSSFDISFPDDTWWIGIENSLGTEVRTLQYLSSIRMEQLNLLASKLKLLPSTNNSILNLKKSTPISQNQYILTASSRPPSTTSIVNPKDKESLSRLLRLVAEGEQDQAEILLKGKPPGMFSIGAVKGDPSLLLYYGDVTDLSGRTFHNITAFQYALWALDWHMWKMIQKYLPEPIQVEQFAELESKGTRYGKHFCLDTLIEAMQTYNDKYEAWDDKQRESHWCKVVGGAQRLLPAHVINEYCRPDCSLARRIFWDAKLPRKRVSWKNREDWFKTGLGTKFAWIQNGVGVLLGKSIEHIPLYELNMLKLLAKARAEQLELLSLQLTQASSLNLVVEEKQQSNTNSSSNSKTVSISVMASTSQSSHTLMPEPKSLTSAKTIDPYGSNITNSIASFRKQVVEKWVWQTNS